MSATAQRMSTTLRTYNSFSLKSTDRTKFSERERGEVVFIVSVGRLPSAEARQTCVCVTTRVKLILSRRTCLPATHPILRARRSRKVLTVRSQPCVPIGADFFGHRSTPTRRTSSPSPACRNRAVARRPSLLPVRAGKS
jgi:hypothetical protein